VRCSLGGFTFVEQSSRAGTQPAQATGALKQSSGRIVKRQELSVAKKLWLVWVDPNQRMLHPLSFTAMARTSM
jgi:hypothetical protein